MSAAVTRGTRRPARYRAETLRDGRTRVTLYLAGRVLVHVGSASSAARFLASRCTLSPSVF